MSESMITGLRANYTAIAGKLDALKTGKSGSRFKRELSGCSSGGSGDHRPVGAEGRHSGPGRQVQADCPGTADSTPFR